MQRKRKCLFDAWHGHGLEQRPALVFVKHNFTKKSLFSRQSLVRQLTDDGTHHLPAHIPEKFRESAIVSQTIKPKLGKQATISDLEQTTLAPKVEGRIRKLDDKVQEV